VRWWRNCRRFESLIANNQSAALEEAIAKASSSPQPVAHEHHPTESCLTLPGNDCLASPLLHRHVQNRLS
jgi:hypothetical protein